MSDEHGSEFLSPPLITVLSRDRVRGYRGDEPYILVSIHSPGMNPVKLRPDPMRRARINLCFHDTSPQWEAGWGGGWDSKAIYFSELQAVRIASFLRKYPNTAIVINCLAGVSRSAGVAVGIRAALGLDPGEFAASPYEPNPHVRRLVQHALQSHSRLPPAGSEHDTQD